MRRLTLICVITLALAGELQAAVPTGCVYPGSADNFEAVGPGDKLTSTLWNRFMCAINKLQAQLLASVPPISNCVNTSLAPSERKTVPVTLATGSSSSKVFGTIKDTSAGFPRLDIVGTQSGPFGGSLIANVTVFNHDASNTRTGTVCAMVLP